MSFDKNHLSCEVVYQKNHVIQGILHSSLTLYINQRFFINKNICAIVLIKVVLIKDLGPTQVKC